MITIQKMTSAVVLFATMFAAQTVFAFYNPSTGRFLSRDPIGEPGFQLLQKVAQGTSPVALVPAAQQSSRWINRDSISGGEIEEQDFDFDDTADGNTVGTATDQTPELLYAFVQNNPVNLIDELGLTVYIQAHGVALGINHSKVTMVVSCGSRWFGVAPFTNPMPYQVGQYYATIGAGPKNRLLKSGVNRERDVQLWRNKFSAVISDPAGMSDDEFIAKLIAANAAYPNNLPYALFPTRKSKRYNSNGYASGILLYVTGSMPPEPPRTPGFDKPVPASEF